MEFFQDLWYNEHAKFKGKEDSMKRVFLLDYENTAVRGLYGISELGYGDKVVVFCSNENIRSALVDLLKVYEERRVEIRVHLLKKRAMNALDFMITTYLGFELSIESQKEIFVVSADRGYESAIDMAHELSNGIFIGFHESIYECLHENFRKSLPQKDDEVMAIDAEETLIIESEPRQRLSAKQVKALSGPVADVDGGKKKRSSATVKQRAGYRKSFMQRMETDGIIPNQYIDQLTAFMDKSRSMIEFREKAIVALGGKNKDLVGEAVKYYLEYDRNRP